MRKTILNLLFGASAALAGCGGSDGAGCRGFCDWIVECSPTSASISDCVQECEQRVEDAPPACHAAYEELGACLAGSDSCSRLACHSEHNAVSEACRDDAF